MSRILLIKVFGNRFKEQLSIMLEIARCFFKILFGVVEVRNSAIQFRDLPFQLRGQ